MADLFKHSLSGKMHFAIQNMYRAVKARVRCGNGAGLTHFYRRNGSKGK